MTLQAILLKELGRARLTVPKSVKIRVLAIEVHDDLGRSVHKTYSSPRKNGQMDS